MIHNIEDGKKKAGQRCNSDFSGYLSDEELMNLIGQVEAEEMLHAPIHLKRNVFAQIHSEKRGARKRQVFVYRAKVLTAMAAALAVLIFMPNDGVKRMFDTPVRQEREDESLAQMAKRRQQDQDSNWEKYIAERERGGIKGVFEDINAAVARFGARLYHETD